MSLFKTLIGKPLRWVASSISGKKGRDMVDKHEQLLEAAAIHYLPMLGSYTPELANGKIIDWAIQRGASAEIAEAIAAEVLKRAGEGKK